MCIDCGEGHCRKGTACVKESLLSQLLNITNSECECGTEPDVSTVLVEEFGMEINPCQCGKI